MSDHRKKLETVLTLALRHHFGNNFLERSLGRVDRKLRRQRGDRRCHRLLKTLRGFLPPQAEGDDEVIGCFGRRDLPTFQVA